MRVKSQQDSKLHNVYMFVVLFFIIIIKLAFFFTIICLLVSGAVYKFTNARGHGGFLHWDNIAWYVIVKQYMNFFLSATDIKRLHKINSQIDGVSCDSLNLL